MGGRKKVGEDEIARLDEMVVSLAVLSPTVTDGKKKGMRFREDLTVMVNRIWLEAVRPFVTKESHEVSTWHDTT
jgi:hypothetical protein